MLARFARRTTVAFQVPDDATGILFTTAGLLDACRRLPMALAQDANPPGLIRWWLDLPDRLGGSGGEVPGLRVVERFRERLTPIEPLGRTLVDRVARVRGRQPAPLTAAGVTAAGVIAAGQVTLRQELPGAASPLVPAGRNPELVGRLSDQASRIAGPLRDFVDERLYPIPRLERVLRGDHIVYPTSCRCNADVRAPRCMDHVIAV